MITYLTRFVLIVAGAMGGFAAAGVVDWSAETGFSENLVIFIFVILGSAIGYVLGGILGRELASLWSRAEDRLRDVAATDIVLATSGLIVGLLVAVLASWPLRVVRPVWLSVASTALLFVTAGYVGVRVALVKRHDFARLFPRVAAQSAEDEADGSPASRTLLLDTSAVIDGRFLELKRLGFLAGTLRVPRFVLGELHTLADSADDTRRARGRRGLDLLDTLVGRGEGLDIFETDFPEIAEVDRKLMKLASDLGAAVITVDYNLTKVARVQDLEVLNVNELAAAVRPTFLPGEGIRIRVVREGKEPDQGVGYLEDGTMVVVQQGKSSIGSEADAEVTSVLQTSAGRMIFARLSSISENSGEDG